MSRTKGSNKYIVAQKVALAGTYWQKGKDIGSIADMLGVSERQIYHYINRWLYHRKEVLDLIAFVANPSSD